jgi:hypothetical protein
MRGPIFLHLFVVLAIILIVAAFADAAKAPGSPDSTKIKPDIAVSDMKITRVSVTSAGHNVQINATVVNRIRDTSTGPFKVKVEWTENPALGFNLLATGGVENLAYDSTSAVVRNGKTLTFSHVVPTGKNYKYRVTADYMGQVNETDETNNVASAGYLAA